MPTRGPLALEDPGSSNHVDVSSWMSRASSVDGWGSGWMLGRKA